MRKGWETSSIRSFVWEISLIHGSRSGLAGQVLPAKVVKGPPAPVATEAVAIARDKVLLREICVSSIVKLDRLLKWPHGAKGPAAPTIALVSHGRAAAVLATPVVAGCQIG